MEISKTVQNAQELFDFLKQIPEGQRSLLPIIVVTPVSDTSQPIKVNAYDTTETQGNIERGFEIIVE